MSNDHIISLIDNLLTLVERPQSSLQQQWTAKKIRQTFVDYFVQEHEHTFVPSSSVVPHNDPTILFANAGMNQFKPIFLNQVSPDSELAKWKRAANSQKCIRAGGKHNDLEDVGSDTYHHTFFEMLGNWSFGDYFKEGAIDMAWNLLVNVYGLDPERLYATYFKPDEGNDSVEEDLEAKAIWGKYLPKSRILPFNAKDNFWEMGDTGPCGPCTEIHYDRIGNRDASSLVNRDDPNVIEIWNLVFIQFNREADGSLMSLPDKHVDTGMGFERVASILQDKTSNYDTDIFAPILSEISRVTGSRPYQGLMGKDDVDGIDKAYRVVADHIRTLTFAITDGARCGSDGRNSVLRRILRRAIRYGRMKLGATKESLFFSRLVDVVVDHFGDAYPELREKRDNVRELIEAEEKQFNRTLDAGEKKFKRVAKRTRAIGSNIISGPEVFRLKSQFGFPPDLTAIMAEELNMEADLVGCEEVQAEEVRKQKEKEANKVTTAVLQFAGAQVDYLQSNNIAFTDQEPKYTWEPIEARVVALYDGENFVEKLEESDEKTGLYAVVLDRTSFYAESGGQVGDSGTIQDSSDENVFTVSDTQEFGGYVLHIGQVASGELNVGQTLNVQVDYDRRKLIAPNHTMTHVLNFALREVLGGQCNQRGSIVDEDRTRFDFSHDQVLKLKEIKQIQEICQSVIDQELDVFTQVVPYRTAETINALRAVFGERYPENVRVVSVGKQVDSALSSPTSPDNLKYSIELCGGTHLSNTKEARRFLVTSQEPVSAGVRRLEAVTFYEADRIQQQGEALVQEAEKLMVNVSNEELGAIIQEVGNFGQTRLSYEHRDQLNRIYENLVDKNKEQRKDMAKKLKKSAVEEAKKLSLQAKAENFSFVVQRFRVDNDPKSLKEVVKAFGKKAKNVPIFAYSVAEDGLDQKQIILQATVPKNMTGQISAEEWVGAVLELIQGGGGGREMQYTAVGRDSTQVNRLHEVARGFAESKFS